MLIRVYIMTGPIQWMCPFSTLEASAVRTQRPHTADKLSHKAPTHEPKHFEDWK